MSSGETFSFFFFFHFSAKPFKHYYVMIFFQICYFHFGVACAIKSKIGRYLDISFKKNKNNNNLKLKCDNKVNSHRLIRQSRHRWAQSGCRLYLTHAYWLRAVDASNICVWLQVVFCSASSLTGRVLVARCEL